MKALVTGAAGFIGSHLVEALLKLGHEVVGVDNMSTGRITNLAAVKKEVGVEDFRFRLHREDVCEFNGYQGVDVVFHLAALGSVPRSLADPPSTHNANVTGFLSVIENCRKAQVKRMVYASSSSVYGDYAMNPKYECYIGSPLSPYAASKRINEIYAETYWNSFLQRTVGLRFFNVFGPRQRPDGAYAAVIPKWVDAMKKNQEIEIFGDGATARDFTYVWNAVDALILAADLKNPHIEPSSIFNVGAGHATTLTSLHQSLARRLGYSRKPHFVSPRPGDIRNTVADLGKSTAMLRYIPRFTLEQGLDHWLGGGTDKDREFSSNPLWLFGATPAS